MIKNIYQLLRPQQWIKNGIVLTGLIFSGNAANPDSVIAALIATGLFCLLSSTIYIINDLADAEADRKHPIKSKRPIASGKISTATAAFLAIIIGATSLTGCYFLNFDFFLIAVAYLVLNLFYSFKLKHIVIIDVMSIAFGFVLRAVAGAVVIDVEFSGWLLISSFLLALFLGFGKRRAEIAMLEDDGSQHRPSLKHYSKYFLDQLIGVVTPAVVVCYLLYVISPEIKEKLGTDYLYLTIPFVIYGIFRYLYLIHLEDEGGSPTWLFLTDRPIMMTVLLWLATAISLLYIF